MPIYEYECAKCGKTIEVIQRFSDKPLKKHEKCGGALTKLISAGGFQFKGTGWYVTDYARKSSPENAKADSKETSTNGNKEGSTDKPATEKAGKKDKPSKSGKSGSSKD
jgi:putative FmdB family regulatory protein